MKMGCGGTDVYLLNVFVRTRACKGEKGAFSRSMLAAGWGQPLIPGLDLGSAGGWYWTRSTIRCDDISVCMWLHSPSCRTEDESV